MSSIIQDIIDDPGEYLPMLLILTALLLFWGGLCLSGFVSLRAATRRRRFWFALSPLVFGTIGVLTQIPFSMESEGFNVSFDFRWFFVVPLLFGIAGVFLWWRVRHDSVTDIVIAEPGAPPNGGPATRLADTGVTEEPPSVS
jgi:hypothetical protein